MPDHPVHGAMTSSAARSARRRPRGITSVEVMVGAAVSLLAIGTLFSFSQTQQRAFSTQSTYADAQSVTRTVIDLLGRELRMATYKHPGLVGGCGYNAGIVEATPTSIRFQQDLNSDGVVTGAGEDVAYRLQGGQITRQDVGTNGAAVPVVDGVPDGGLGFRYFDGHNPATELVPAGSPPALTAAQRDCVVKVTLSVAAQLPNPDPRNPYPLTSTAATEVVIRNRAIRTSY